ncbi:MAG: serine hydrolase [Sphingobium sp.]
MRLKLLLQAGVAGLFLLCAGCSAVDPVPAIARYSGDGAVGAQALRDVVEPLFDPDSVGNLGETRAVILMHDGQIVAERYGPGYGPDSLYLSWSLGKTVTALLVGIMVADGRLALDEPVPVPAWRQGADPRGAITLRQMLGMASGIANRESKGPREDTDVLRMLAGDGATDMARYAESKPLASQPGTTFNYSTATTVILCDMMTRLLTDSDDPKVRREAMMLFVRERLMKPAGLTSLTPEFDTHGTMIGGAFMHMTARDYARLGELLRRGGQVGGKRIVPASWVRFMTSPSRANGGYGGQIWLNREGAKSMFIGEAPESLYAAQGLMGQYVAVSPRQRLTLVRLGVTGDGEMPALRAELAKVMRVVPGG